MGWSCGWDNTWDRWIGYGVPAYCDHPKCSAEIDRGLSYVCCGQEPYGGDKGCGLYFCGDHANWNHRCSPCVHGRKPYKPKPDHPDWLKHVLEDESWEQWRKENPADVAKFKAALPRHSTSTDSP